MSVNLLINRGRLWGNAKAVKEECGVNHVTLEEWTLNGWVRHTKTGETKQSNHHRC